MNNLNRTNDEYHVASFIAHITPKDLETAKKAIDKISGTEIHAETEQGKLIITIEAESHQAIAKRVDLIKDLTGVNSLAQVYHQYTAEE